MRFNSYRGGLPKPDSLGRWRPEVGCDHDGKRVRFQVGNKSNTTESEALKRLNVIRDLYDRQCAELKHPYWANWVLAWATKIAQCVPVLVETRPDAKDDTGTAADHLVMIRRLQEWGVRAIYTEDIDLAVLGSLAITRASHVEPDQQGRWWADLSPVDGGVLGAV